MIIQTIHMKSVTAEGQGTLSVFEGSRDVPFDIKRIYYIHGAPQGTQRGGHAHKALPPRWVPCIAAGAVVPLRQHPDPVGRWSRKE